MTSKFSLIARISALAFLITFTSCVEEQKETISETPSPDAATSVVRVNATVQPHNFIRPWEKGSALTRNGLGAVLSGNRVLVTAEMVADRTYVELEKADTGEKAPAKVLGVDYEANLALIAPEKEDSDFLEEYMPLDLAMNVTTGDEVEVWQLEENGSPASTDATVIQVGVGKYFVDGAYFLNYVIRGSLQYRAGSFTLPVVKDGDLAGLLLSYDSDQQTSRIIPAPIIKHFIEDLDDGEYGGFPNMGVSYAQTLDEQLRKYLGIDEMEGGVFVRQVAKESSADVSGLQEGDVILEMGGYPIDARGNYEHPLYGKLNFSHLVRGDATVDQLLRTKIVRDGEEMELDLELKRKSADEYLIDPYMFDRGPRFLILGGMIFQELTLPYLKAWGDSWVTRAPFRLVHAHAHQDVYEDEGREKLVILSATLRTPSTLGYESLSNLIVTKVNDQPINDLADLKEALQQPADGIHKIEFDEDPKLIFVDDKMAEAVNQQLGQLGISQVERLD